MAGEEPLEVDALFGLLLPLLLSLLLPFELVVEFLLW